MEKYFSKINKTTRIESLPETASAPACAKISGNDQLLLSPEHAPARQDDNACLENDTGTSGSDCEMCTDSEPDQTTTNNSRSPAMKSKRKLNYAQKARGAWLGEKSLKDWVVLVESGNASIVKCKYCACTLGSKRSTLKAHAASKKHLLAASPFINITQPKLPFKKSSIPIEIKKAEVRIALFVAKHSTMRTVEHLIETFKSSFTDPNLQSLRMKRTKCGQVIKKALHPFFKDALRQDIGDSKYSLIIDESTDIGVVKYLGIVIKYFSQQFKRIDTTYLTLAKLDSCDAEAIVACISNVLSEFQIPIKGLVGLGTDNASVMVGVNNGVHAKLRKDVPGLQLIPCVCHSLQLAVSAATKEFFPSEVEFIISETYNWFNRSSTRQNAYNDIFRAINDGHDPHKIVRSCQTRLLSVESAVKRILDQWDKLRTHFEIAKVNEKCFAAQELFRMFKDDLNKAYLKFIYPYLAQTQRINKIFESRNADTTNVLEELCSLLSSVLRNITTMADNPNFDQFKSSYQDFLIKTPYLGYSFEEHIAEMSSSNTISKPAESVLRDRCLNFLIKFANELRQRLPSNISTLRKMNCFSYSNSVLPHKDHIIDFLRQNGVKEELALQIQCQWENLDLYKWNTTQQKPDTINFWVEVNSYEDAVGENPFYELAQFVIGLLVLPISNAEVERLFSQMNLVKTKIRNRMQTEMLNSIISVRSALTRLNVCCASYEIPDDLLKLMNNQIYEDKKIEEPEPEFDDFEFVDYLTEVQYD